MSLARFVSHVSPSALNLAGEAGFGIWGLQYLKGYKSTGPALWRGNAVEAGFAALQRTKDLNRAIDMALTNFDQNAAGEITEEIEKERKLVEPMVRRLVHWKSPSELTATQLKVEMDIGVSVPCLGYIDFAYQSRHIMDLKTTERLPRQGANARDRRQVGFYAAAYPDCAGASLFYVSAKDHVTYHLPKDQLDAGFRQLKQIAQALENALSRANNADDFMLCHWADPEHYRYPKQLREQDAKEGAKAQAVA